ncbi:MAG: AAA-like domain-containing protein [Cyanobacteria bacterium P01_E01_bin.42]
MNQQSPVENELQPEKQEALIRLRQKLNAEGKLSEEDRSIQMSLRQLASLWEYLSKKEKKPNTTKARKTLEYFENLGYISVERSQGARPSTITWLNKELPFAPKALKRVVPITPHYIDRSIDRYLLEKLQTETRDEKRAELIKIKGSKGLGKTSLLKQICNQLQLTQAVCFIDLKNSTCFHDQKIFENFDTFLHTFTRALIEELKESIAETSLIDLQQYWQEELLPGEKCTNYLKEKVFAKIHRPKTMIIAHLDEILGYEAIQEPFIKLIRNWHETEMKFPRHDRPIVWPYMVIAYSHGEYARYGVVYSVLENVGIEKELTEFTKEEVIQLAKTYDLQWEKKQIHPLFELVGGHPQLLEIAFRKLEEGISFQNLMQSTTQIDSPFLCHLLKLEEFLNEKKSNKIKECFKKILKNEIPTDRISQIQLLRMGLITVNKGKIEIRCQLYKQYFESLGDGNESNE